MTNESITELTPEALQAIRTSRGLSVKDFWERRGYSLNRGYAYEAGRGRRPEHVRRLVHIEYELGIPTNPDSDDGKQFARILRENNPAQLLDIRKRIAMGAGIINAPLSELKI